MEDNKVHQEPAVHKRGRPKKSEQLQKLTPEEKKIRKHNYNIKYQKLHGNNHKLGIYIKRYRYAYKYLKEHNKEIFNTINELFNTTIERNNSS